MNELLKKNVIDYIDRNKSKFISVGRKLYSMPELAYREYNTSKFLADSLRALGVNDIKNLAVTGVAARLRLNNNDSGKAVGIISELDALYTPTHVDCDKKTGAAHTCGHHMQSAVMINVCDILINSKAINHLNGDVCFFGCPAEEGTPEDIFDELTKGKLIEKRSGKQEMLRLGAFDKVDMLLSTHALINDDSVTEKALLSAGCNGFSTLIFTFIGKAAHPSMNPAKGINALNAAVLAIVAIQAVKESFPLDDFCNTIISLKEVVEAPGAIPEKSILQVIVKSRTEKVLTMLEEKVIKAAQGAALSIGCEIVMEKTEGYKSHIADENIARVYMKNASDILGCQVKIRPHGYYSNDLGNVSQIVPTAQIVFGGFGGALHSDRFCIKDEELAYVIPAKVIACTIIDLLS